MHARDAHKTGLLGGHYPEQNRVRGLWVGCTAVLLYCCTEIPFDAAKYSTYFISALHTCALGMAFFFHCAPGVGSRP